MRYLNSKGGPMDGPAPVLPEQRLSLRLPGELVQRLDVQVDRGFGGSRSDVGRQALVAWLEQAEKLETRRLTITVDVDGERS